MVYIYSNIFSNVSFEDSDYKSNIVGYFKYLAISLRNNLFKSC